MPRRKMANELPRILVWASLAYPAPSKPLSTEVLDGSHPSIDGELINAGADAPSTRPPTERRQPGSDDAVINTVAAATITIQSGDNILVQSVTTATTDTLSVTGGALTVTAGSSTRPAPSDDE